MPFGSYISANFLLQRATLKLLREKNIITDDDIRAIIAEFDAKIDAAQDRDTNGMADVVAMLRKTFSILD